MTKLELPVLPLRDIVVFPHISIPLYVGRAKSLKALEKADALGKLIFLVAQSDPGLSNPEEKDLFRSGTIARIKQTAKLPDGNLKILVEGQKRARVVGYSKHDPDGYFMAEVEEFAPPAAIITEEEKMMMRTLISNYETYLKVSGRPLDDFFKSLEIIEDADKLVDLLATQIPLKIKDRQELLEMEGSSSRLDRMTSLILSEIEVIKLDRKIKSRVRDQIEKSQKDYYLNEQLNAIHKELGNENGDPKSEAQELEKRLAQKKMPEAARTRAEKEIKKLRAGAHAMETSVIRSYIELILDLPWDEVSEDLKDLANSQAILDEDHYGLKEIKDRIIEFLAVRARVESPKSPIVCFVGPPGVGKTSLARSIARSLGRKFEKVSLGGLRDEAELRGHRRTYIGALPGKIISAIRKAGVSNPVILLDEIDKVGNDWRGDPSSALLEILDPEQNKSFNDHYLDLEYDLSKVMFIATANMLDSISAPLRDRMEIIRLTGYTEDEKVAIARGFILPKALENHGLKPEHLSIDDEALKFIVQRYTKEAGVRSLEKEINKISRKVVKAIELKKLEMIQLKPSQIPDYLGVPKFRQEVLETKDEVGSATGLAWTPTGGEVLTIEASAVAGKGEIQITGQLGQVMQESARAAITYIRSRSEDFGIAADYFSKHDIHIHVPEGGIPKDGPSAGITMTCAVLSAVTNTKVHRGIGMTGEVTLRGRVLPIGGLKEKILGAKRAGIKTIIYPFENQPELKEIDPLITEGLSLLPVDHVDEVIRNVVDLPQQHLPKAPVSELRGQIGREVRPPDLSH